METVKYTAIFVAINLALEEKPPVQLTNIFLVKLRELLLAYFQISKIVFEKKCQPRCVNRKDVSFQAHLCQEKLSEVFHG